VTKSPQPLRAARPPTGQRRTAPRRSPLLAILVALAWTLLLTPGVLAASSAAPSATPTATQPPPGPPFPEPVDGQAVYDMPGVLQPATVKLAEQIIDGIESQTGAEIAIYIQATGEDDVTPAQADSDAAALMDQWGVGRVGVDDGLVIFMDLDTSLKHGQVQLYAGSGFDANFMDDDARQAVFDNDMAPLLKSGDFDSAILAGLGVIAGDVISPTPTDKVGLPGTSGPPAGPPFPPPVDQRAVYDYAGIFTAATISHAEDMIDTIEARTGAEVVVYTQELDEFSIDESETEAHARALIDQWGIGRKGFDDGMVIFFDLDPSLEHGQVQLYAAPGFENAYLSNSERQSIFNDDMLPLLQAGDFDGALQVALQKVDAAATPEHAASLDQARQFNAVLGLLGAPIVLFGLIGWALFHWLRFGKDPVYLDDASVLMPAPPPELTAASGAMVMDGGTSRRALTTAMLDLASRGLISFREDKGLLSHKVGVDVDPAKGDATAEAQRALNSRRPIGPAEDLALSKLQLISDGTTNYISPEDMPKFGSYTSDFDAALEKHVVDKGWFAEKPSATKGRWIGRGSIALVVGVVASIIAWNIPMSGLLVIGIALVIAGVVVIIIAQAMPAVTMSGAMIRAMLAAYKRTLEQTMAQARSMQQVVDDAKLDWLVTPDQAVVWGTALGLQDDIQDVLSRSMEDVKTTGASGVIPYFPIWYTNSSGSPMTAAGMASSGGSLFSNSAIPDFGGMVSALGTIGNSPSSSGGGSGGGGFSGGGSGGGGGGAGGGF
jgi:uncharacterized membrane protein YgcG